MDALPHLPVGQQAELRARLDSIALELSLIYLKFAELAIA